MSKLEQLRDFRNFLYVVWKHLNLPDPTPLQYDISDFMQHGPKRSVIMAFRGVGKSWICSAYAVHQLLLDPTKNILVVSASKNRADDFSTFTLKIIHDIPVLQGLIPKKDQRFSKIAFDVEFEAILKPLDTSRILFLGTPQCEDSIYNKLRERGYNARIWTSEYPPEDLVLKNYDDDVAPYITERITDETVGKSTEPTRFSDFDLEERKLSYGRTGYSLQFMLNPRLSDADRYPLKINDLIIQDVDVDLAPEKILWSSDKDNENKDLPNVGLGGDRFHKPFKILGDMIEYTGSVLSIDPSGRGKDETGFAVVKMLNGQLFVPQAGGLKGGYDEQTLKQLVHIAKSNKVNKIIIESNFGDGMFMELLKPLFMTSYPVTIEEVRHNKQKELRIIDVLEPVLNQHKLIIDPSVVQHDYKSAQAYPIEHQARYMLIYQLSRITRDKGSLTHDDRIDALSIAVNYWVEQMNQDVDNNINFRKEELLEKELVSFSDSFNKVKGRSNNTLWM